MTISQWQERCLFAPSLPRSLAFSLTASLPPPRRRGRPASRPVSQPNPFSLCYVARRSRQNLDYSREGVEYKGVRAVCVWGGGRGIERVCKS